MTIHLDDARLIDWRTLDVTRGNFRVDEDDLTRVDAIPQGAEVVRCGGRFVTRAFAIGHHHVYSTLARGMPPPARAPRSFVEILESIWWTLDRALDADMIRASALAAGIEAVRCGCTFIIDHHASPTAPTGSLRVIADALDEVGVGHLLCYELSDRDGPEAFEAGFAETERYLERRRGLVGLHASFTVSDASLERAVDLARAHETGVHIHVAEAPSDEEHCRATHGCSVAERLRRAGALDLPATILAHGLHLDDAERAIVAASAAWIVHCTESNANNGVGAFDPRGLGDRIMIGTDGMHSDPLAGAHATFLEGQAHGGLAPLDAYRRLRRVHDYLEATSVPGAGASDLVVLDYDPPTPVTSANWPAHVVYGLASRHVRTVVRGGSILFDEGTIRTVDEAAIMDEARRQAKRLWERL